MKTKNVLLLTGGIALVLVLAYALYAFLWQTPSCSSVVSEPSVATYYDPPHHPLVVDANSPETQKKTLASFNQLSVYRAERGNVNTLVLKDQATSTIIAVGLIDRGGIHTVDFESATFSPLGNYIAYVEGMWESSNQVIYDIKNHKTVLTVLGNGKFNEKETRFYTCEINLMNGSTEARIYSIPEFSVLTDLYKIYLDLTNLANYREVTCSENADHSALIFNFNPFPGDGISKKITVDLTTGQIINVELGK